MVRAAALILLMLAGCAQSPQQPSESARIKALEDDVQALSDENDDLTDQIADLQNANADHVALFNRNVETENGRNNAQNELIDNLRRRVDTLERAQQ